MGTTPSVCSVLGGVLDTGNGIIFGPEEEKLRNLTEPHICCLEPRFNAG